VASSRNDLDTWLRYWQSKLSALRGNNDIITTENDIEFAFFKLETILENELQKTIDGIGQDYVALVGKQEHFDIESADEVEGISS